MSNIRLLAAVILLICAVGVYANPFTTPKPSSGEDSSRMISDPSPVRTTKPDETLVSRQMALRNELADMFLEWKSGRNPAAIRIILLLSFLYGVFHALGPGHRKTVIFSVYLARKAPVTEPGITGIALALLHGGTAIAVLLAFRGITGAISARADTVSRWMEGGSYVLLIILAAVLAVQAFVELFRVSSGRKRVRASLGAVLISGMYPCPGAILILVLALTLDVMLIGIVAVLAMSVGMSFPIIAAGYLAWFGRTGLFLGLKAKEDRIARISSAIELGGYLLLLAFSLYMAQPFLLSVLRMIQRL